MSTALLIVDVQHDFTVGSLRVPDAEAIIEPICELSHAYEYVIASRDHHPDNHVSFTQWPVHCVAGSPGAQVDVRIRDLEPTYVYKGHRPKVEAYSAFEGHVFGGGPLSPWLVEHGVRRVDVCGLALDYCVKETALSARRADYVTNVLLDLTRPVEWKSGMEAIIELLHADVGLHTL